MLQRFETTHGVVEFEVEDKCIEVELIMVDSNERGNGYGTELVKGFFRHVLDYYDFYAIRLSVCDNRCFRDSPGLKQDQLIEWYAKFGFTIYDYVIIEDRECPRMVILPSEVKDALN